MALTIGGALVATSPSPPPLAVATTASRRERIASSRSIVHYEKQKCAARQWRDPWPHRTIDLTIYTYTYIFLLLSPSIYLSLAVYPTAYAAGVRRESVREHEGDEGREREGEKKEWERKGAENKEEVKIEMKCRVARSIRGLSMYDERKTKTRDDSEATSYGSISVRRRKDSMWLRKR